MSDSFEQDKIKDFTVIRNSIFKDSRLSAKAKGVACQLLSLPPSWDYSVRGIVSLFSDGEASIRNALTELEDFGYLRREQDRSSGKFGKVKYIVTDMLKSEKPYVENPRAVKPQAVNPQAENPSQLNTKELNTKELNTKELNTDTGKRQRRAKNADLNNTPSLRPSIEDIESYIREKDLTVDGRRFYDFFEASEWIDSKGNPVRNWKQKLITWSNNNDNGRGGKKRQGIRGTVGKGDSTIRDGAPKWFKPFDSFPADDRSQNDA